MLSSGKFQNFGKSAGVKVLTNIMSGVVEKLFDSTLSLAGASMWSLSALWGSKAILIWRNKQIRILMDLATEATDKKVSH